MDGRLCPSGKGRGGGRRRVRMWSSSIFIAYIKSRINWPPISTLDISSWVSVFRASLVPYTSRQIKTTIKSLWGSVKPPALLLYQTPISYQDPDP